METGAAERRGSESFVDQSQVLQLSNYGLDILARLNSARADGCLTDSVLVAGSEEFPCHRNVLAMSSPYFRAMFGSDLRESRESRVCIVETSAWTLRRVLEFAYTGRVEITVDNAQDLLAAGSLFQYPEIVDACCAFLRRHLHPSNCLGIEDFAHMHCCADLETSAHQHALENFSAVVEYEEFASLPMARLITYLSSDLIDVRTEESVFEAVVAWIAQEPDRRTAHACALMEHIRLATVGVEYLEAVVEKHPLVASCDKCSQLVDDAKRYHETKTEKHGQRRRSMQTETFTPRPSTVAKEVLVLVGGLSSLNYLLSSVEMYDPAKNKWTLLPDMPQTPSWFTAAALDNDIYVAGGILDGHIVAGVWRFESGKRLWDKAPSMLTPRARHTSAAWDGRLYVVGGITLSGVDGKVVTVEDIECYSPATGAWTVVGQSPFPRKQSHLVPYHRTLVEIGGTQGGASVQTMESYLCEDGDVTYSGEQFILPECIQFSQIVVLGGVFYIIWEDSKRVISLSPEKRTFRRLPDMHYEHIHAGASVLNDKIYVAGGLIDSKPSRLVECYDPAKDEWTVLRNTRQARACHGAVTIQMC